MDANLRGKGTQENWIWLAAMGIRPVLSWTTHRPSGFTNARVEEGTPVGARGRWSRRGSRILCWWQGRCWKGRIRRRNSGFMVGVGLCWKALTERKQGAGCFDSVGFCEGFQLSRNPFSRTLHCSEQKLSPFFFCLLDYRLFSVHN